MINFKTGIVKYESADYDFGLSKAQDISEINCPIDGSKAKWLYDTLNSRCKLLLFDELFTDDAKYVVLAYKLYKSGDSANVLFKMYKALSTKTLDDSGNIIYSDSWSDVSSHYTVIKTWLEDKLDSGATIDVIYPHGFMTSASINNANKTLKSTIIEEFKVPSIIDFK